MIVSRSEEQTSHREAREGDAEEKKRKKIIDVDDDDNDDR